MYQLVTSRFKTDRRAGRWVEGDLSREPIALLSAKYADVWFFITYPAALEQQALRLSEISNLLNEVASSVSVQEWLTSMGNRTLPFTEKLPTFKERLVEYASAWQTDYDVQAQGRAGVVEDNQAGPARQDLIINHPRHTPEYIADHCLWSVNGYYHLSDWNEQGVRVIDGQTSVRIANDNEVGLTSFEAIGKIKFCPIKEDMVNAMNEVAPLWDGAYVTIPGSVDLESKTVLLVLGGYLLVLSDGYKRVGERTWKIDLSNVMYLDRFLQSRKNIDLSSMKIDSPEDNPSFALLSSLKSDESVMAYLTLSQSFFVIVEAETFFQEYEPIEYIGFPGRFLSNFKKQLPLMGAYGKMLEYHIIKEDSEYVYCATENVRHNYDANRRNWADSLAVDGGRYPFAPCKPAQAYLRYLGTES